MRAMRAPLAATAEGAPDCLPQVQKRLLGSAATPEAKERSVTCAGSPQPTKRVIPNSRWRRIADIDEVSGLDPRIIHRC